MLVKTAMTGLPKWAKIAISAFISVIVVGVVFAFVEAPGVATIIMWGFTLISAVVAVSTVVYDLLFGE